MRYLRRLHVLFVSHGLLLLALALSGLASLGARGGSFDAVAKTELMREAGRLQRMARSVRRDESLRVGSEEEQRSDPSEPLHALLAGLALGPALADLPATEIYESLLQPHRGAGLHELGIPRGSPYQRRALSELGLGERFALQAVAIKRKGKDFTLHPPSETRLKSGDVLLVLGSTRDADALRAELG